MSKKKGAKKKNQKKRSFKKKLLRFFIKGILVFILLLVAFIASVNYGFFGHLYSSEELKDFENENASLIVSNDGMILGKIFAENRTNVKFDQIPQHLLDALVATEDARFFEHKGIDTWSLLRVFFKTLLMNQESAGGGSTISQQLAKNMYGRRSFGPITMPVNKCKEAILAYRLESIYDKKEILTLYLNTVPFGERVFGIQAASLRYYNKDVSRLKMQESAVLVGILKANTYYNPKLHPDHALERRNTVLNQMLKYGYLKLEECDSLKKMPLEISYANLERSGPANYFVYEAKKEARNILEQVNKESAKNWDLEKDGLIIKTSLNGRLQKYALQAFKGHLKTMQKRLRSQYQKGSSKRQLEKLLDAQISRLGIEDEDRKRKQELFDWEGFYSDSISARDSLEMALTLIHAGMLAMDPNTGAIKVWVGGIDYRTQPNDQIKARRPLASTFKPILYASALEQGLEPCEYLDNDSISFEDFDNWTPRNYDGTYGGKYSMAASLAKSLNVPTLNLYQDLDFEKLDYLWKKLGFSSTLKDLPSTSLGTTNASIYELAMAYSAFANGGKKPEPYIIESIKTEEGQLIYEHKKRDAEIEVMDQAVAKTIAQMLRKAVLEGTGKSLQSVYGVDLDIAGKTGTAQNYSDAWFGCFNSKLVVVSRVGASLPQIHFNTGANGSGSALALPLVAKTLYRAQNSSSTKSLVNGSIIGSDEEILENLNCPDFKEKNVIDKVIDIFEKDGNNKKKKKRSIFDRIFGRK